jgi:uncharacterized protein
VRKVKARAKPALLASPIHGPKHWRAVARVGIELARRTPGADLELVVLFGLLHDARRRTDGHDREHGRRAAALARELAGEGALDLTAERLERLAAACAGHADGHVHEDPTVGVCWDADRLNLWRVGGTPDPALLSTEAARSAEVLAWSSTLHLTPPSWEQVRAMGGTGL